MLVSANYQPLYRWPGCVKERFRNDMAPDEFSRVLPQIEILSQYPLRTNRSNLITTSHSVLPEHQTAPILESGPILRQDPKISAAVMSLLTTQPASVCLLDLPVRLVKIGVELRVFGYQGFQFIFCLRCSRRGGIIPHAHSGAIRSRCQLKFLLLHQQFGNPGSNVALVEEVFISTATLE